MSCEIGGHYWNLDALLKQLEEETEAREGAIPSPTTTQSTKQKKAGRDSSADTAAAMLALSNTPLCCY